MTRTRLCVSLLKVFAVPGLRPREEVASLFPSQNVAWRLRLKYKKKKKRLSVPGFLSLPEAVKVREFSQGGEESASADSPYICIPCA